MDEGASSTHSGLGSVTTEHRSDTKVSQLGTTASAVALAGLVGLMGCTEQASHQPVPGDAPYFAVSEAHPRLALVLSSGGLRGFAHVGVLKALEAHGISPDIVVGSSVGALVGAIYASGREVGEIEQAIAAPDFRLGARWQRAVLPTERTSVYGFVAHHVRHQRIEHFPIGYAAVATNLQRGCMVVFNAGSAAVAVQASTAVPGVFAPTTIGAQPHADGGMTGPVPVRVARALRAQRVIAVDVTYPPGESKLDGLIDRVFQMGLVMVRTMAAQEAREADVLIEPVLPREAQVNLDNRAALISAGESAALAAMPQIRRLLSQPPSVPLVNRPPADLRWCNAPAWETE
jgi:NTE family protein